MPAPQTHHSIRSRQGRLRSILPAAVPSESQGQGRAPYIWDPRPHAHSSRAAPKAYRVLGPAPSRVRDSAHGSGLRTGSGLALPLNLGFGAPACAHRWVHERHRLRPGLAPSVAMPEADLGSSAELEQTAAARICSCGRRSRSLCTANLIAGLMEAWLLRSRYSESAVTELDAWVRGSMGLSRTGAFEARCAANAPAHVSARLTPS